MMESSLEPLPESTNDLIANLYDSEGGRGCRSKRKQTNPTFCPVCQCTLRASDVDQHLHCELEKLQKISKIRGNRLPIGTSASTNSSSVPSNSSATSPGPSSSTPTSDEHYRKYQQVRNNRQSRQKLKYKRRKLNEGIPTFANIGGRSLPGPSSAVGTLDLQCPICYRFKDRAEITMHVDRCLARSERRRKRKRSDGSRPMNLDVSSIDDSSTDYEGEGAEGDVDNDEIDVEGYEEYEWAGQSRIRITSLIPGGVATLFHTANQGASNAEDVDEDLVVDDDDRFGPAQYTESDMIQCASDTRRERGREEALRRAVLSPILTASTPLEPAPPFEDLNNDRLEKRCNSDPPEMAAGSSAGDQSEETASSAPAQVTHSYPVVVSEPPSNGSNSTTSCESQSPPLLTAIDMTVTVPANETADYEPIPILEPVIDNETTETCPMDWITVLSDSTEEQRMQPLVMLDALPRATAWNTVPSLSVIAQDAAKRAQIAGTNPTPCTSTQQDKPINHLVIQSLFARIRELETRLEGDVYKCLICMDRYRTPVISTTCWHVYCEECWLRTLGAKKLCPQCNAITTPNDLRKIFI